MSKIFNTPETRMITIPGSKLPRLASISVSTSGGGSSSAKLPIIGINEFSHHNRQQLDSTLDGTVHVLAACGGLGVCSITFMDRIQDCSGNKTNKNLSALHRYDKLRKAMAGANVTVRIHGNDGRSTLAKFTGIIKSCVATAERKQGMDVLLVTYSMQGVMDYD